MCAEADGLQVTFVTIGQSPRDDIVPDILAMAGDGVAAREVGLLDDLDDAGIAGLAPADGEAALVSRLRDGREVQMSKAKVHARLDDTLARIEAGGTDLCVLLCTGEFAEARCKPALIAPSRLIDGMLAALAGPDTALGVVVPLARQAAQFTEYRSLGRPATVTHATPYDPTANGHDRLDRAADTLADHDLILLNCMGYSEAQRQRVAQRTGKPVLLPRRMLAGAIAQLH